MKKTAEFISVCIMCIIAVFILYGSFLNPTEKFRGGDDIRHHQSSLTTKNTLREIFDFTYISGDPWADQYYWPFHYFGHYVVNNFFSGTPFNFRIYLLIVHALNIIGIYYLAKLMFQARHLAALAALFFLTSRHASQVVTWISAVTHSLCSLFVILSVIAYIRYMRQHSWKMYCIAFFSFFLAWMSKEASLFLIALLFLTDVLFDKGQNRFFKNTISRLWPMALIHLIFLWISWYRYPYSDVAVTWGGAYVAINSLYKLFDFTALLYIPISITPSLKIAVHFVTYLCIVLGILFGGKKERYLILWILLALIPFIFSNFRPIETITRYTYYAFAPFSLLVAHIFHKACKNKWVILQGGVIIYASAYILINGFLIINGNVKCYWPI